jgi:hypothetical protein
MTRKAIVTTTINGPTPAIQAFDALSDWELIVVGDKKTPGDYRLQRGIYLSPEQQEKYDPALSEAIGWNCIQRRNFGFLWAKDLGADVIASVDDDNIPLEGWGESLLVGQQIEVDYYTTDLPAFDPVGATNYPHLWHRGYPLQLVSRRNYSEKTRKTASVDIQADFWNGDPDVDALCRMEHAPHCQFDPRCFPMAANKMGPFNSQNTFLSKDVLEHYFVFPHVGRMDDIWPSYYVQSKGFRVVYGRPSVYQQRNAHDLTLDLRQEYVGYENNLRIVQRLVDDPQSIFAYAPERTARAFELYRRHFRS